MCGIAGLVDPGGIDERLLTRMSAAVVHRGPDDHGSRAWADHGVGLVHRRLSIIDLSEAGRNPLANEDGSVWVVHNGEIYNHEELRRELEDAGHRFSSRCDTEVLVHAYEEWGDDHVERLRGMFAYALYDRRRPDAPRVLLVRDRLGVKPMHVAWDGTRLAFASELAPLRGLPWVDLGIDHQALSEYFAFQCVPAPRTIHRGIRKLGPGQMLVLEAGEVRRRTYWDVAAIQRADDVSAEEAVELAERLCADAVRVHTIADVPVGLFLSGGLDSSAVAAFLGSSETRAFTAGFDVAEHSETSYAELVAGHLGLPHVVAEVGISAVEGALAEVVTSYDEPFADGSAVPTRRVSELARREVKVVLSGDGGDEVFLGYRWHQRWLQGNRVEVVPRPLRRAALSAVSVVPRVRRSWVAGLGDDSFERYARLRELFSPSQIDAVLAPEVRGELDGADPRAHLREAWHEDLDPVTRIQVADLATYLPDDILTKVDRASMAVGLEVRPPLVDHRLVEGVLALPPQARVPLGEPKGLLKRAVGSRLPAEILERPKKGFSAPWDVWMRTLGGKVRSEVSHGAAVQSGLLRPDAVDALGATATGAHLWSLLVLEHWVRRGVVMGPLRILVIPAKRWPSEHAMLDSVYARILPSRGHHVEWVMHTSDAVGPSGDVGWHDSVVHLARGGSALGTRAALVARIVRVLRRKRFDIVQVRNVTSIAALLLLLRPFHRARVVFQMSFPLLEWEAGRARRAGGVRSAVAGAWLRLARRGRRWVLRSSDLLLAVSEEMARGLLAEGVRPQRVIVFPLGADTSADPSLDQVETLRRELELGDGDGDGDGDGPLVLYVGAIAPERELSFLVPVAKRVSASMPEARWVLVGPSAGGEAEHLRAAAARAGLADRFRVLNPVPRCEVPAFLALADVSVSPIPPTPLYVVSSPTKVVESLAFGTPVVATPIPDQADLIERSGGGLVAPFEVGPFADAVLQLLKDPDRAAEAGSQGRAYVLEHRSYERLASVVEDAYRTDRAMTTSPRVLHLIPNLDIGGTERQLVGFADRVSDPGRHRVACFYGLGALADAFPTPPIWLGRLGRHPSDAPGNLRVLRTLRRTIVRGRFDLVHAHLGPSEVLAGLVTPRRVPIVAARRGHSPAVERNPALRLLQDVSHRRVDVLICNSRYLAERTRDEDRWPPPTRVIHNAVDLERFAVAPMPKGPPTVAVVANLHPYKGHERFLGAFALVRERLPGARAVLVGDGLERARLEAVAAAGGLTDAVSFAGQAEDPRPFVEQAHVVALASDTEGFPNALLEAMAMGRPVVATDVGGIPELVRDGVDGLLVPREIEALADALSGLLRDPAERGRMATSARARAEGFTWDRVVRETETVYREVLSGSSARPAASARGRT